MRARAWVAWSSGKDSLWALHLARQSPDLEVVGLQTTITETYGRVSMHGVREALLQAQAAAFGLPLHAVLIPAPCSDEIYQSLMRRSLEEAVAAGVSRIVFGDVALDGVRAYREERLSEMGMEAVFPLWGRDAAALAREMIRGGLRAYVTCLDPRKLPRRLAGRPFDGRFLRDLPPGTDRLGENGEFHTFAWDGPGFAYPLPVRVGDTVEREGFLFTDLTMDSRRTARRPGSRGRPERPPSPRAH